MNNSIHKNKWLVASENTSSSTIRITPNDIGILLAHMTPDQIECCIHAFNGEHYYQTKELFLKRKEALCKVLAEIKFDQ
jgi:hypothetical protein